MSLKAEKAAVMTLFLSVTLDRGMLGKLTVLTCRGATVRLGRLRLRRASRIIEVAVLVIPVLVVEVIGPACAPGLVLVVRLGGIVVTGHISILSYRATITDE